jgi:hypothetical protein
MVQYVRDNQASQQSKVDRSANPERPVAHTRYALTA